MYCLYITEFRLCNVNRRMQTHTLLRGCISTSAYISCEKTITGAIGLRIRRINRLDRASALGYFRRSSSLDWFSFKFTIEY